MSKNKQQSTEVEYLKPNEIPKFEDMPLPIRTETNFIKVLLAWIELWQDELDKTCIFTPILIEKIRSKLLDAKNTDDKEIGEAVYLLANRTSKVYVMGYNQALLDLIDLN